MKFILTLLLILVFGGIVPEASHSELEEYMEKVRDTGMESTVIVVSLHLYDDHEALNKEHVEIHGDDTEVAGWSDCEHQPEQNVAFCDIYVLRPEYVYGDGMDTIGHEFWHGVAGDFHR